MNDETVISRLQPLKSIELDLEDEKNPRINVTIQSGEKEIKHILFRPSLVTLFLSEHGEDEAIQIDALHTQNTVRFRVAKLPGLVDGAA